MIVLAQHASLARAMPLSPSFDRSRTTLWTPSITIARQITLPPFEDYSERLLCCISCSILSVGKMIRRTIAIVNPARFGLFSRLLPFVCWRGRKEIISSLRFARCEMAGDFACRSTDFVGWGGFGLEPDEFFGFIMLAVEPAQWPSAASRQTGLHSAAARRAGPRRGARPASLPRITSMAPVAR